MFNIVGICVRPGPRRRRTTCLQHVCAPAFLKAPWGGTTHQTRATRPVRPHARGRMCQSDRGVSACVCISCGIKRLKRYQNRNEHTSTATHTRTGRMHTKTPTLQHTLTHARAEAPAIVLAGISGRAFNVYTICMSSMRLSQRVHPHAATGRRFAEHPHAAHNPVVLTDPGH